MPRGKPEQAEHVIPKLREVEVELGRGKTVAEAVKKIGVAEQLAEQPGGVAGRTEHVAERGKLRPQQGAATAHVHRPIADRVDSGHELAAGRRARRRDVKIDEPYALVV